MKKKIRPAKVLGIIVYVLIIGGLLGYMVVLPLIWSASNNQRLARVPTEKSIVEKHFAEHEKALLIPQKLLPESDEIEYSLIYTTPPFGIGSKVKGYKIECTIEYDGRGPDLTIECEPKLRAIFDTSTKKIEKLLSKPGDYGWAFNINKDGYRYFIYDGQRYHSYPTDVESYIKEIVNYIEHGNGS